MSFGLVVGFVAYGCSRLVLALPFLPRRVDWESEPRLPSTPRCLAAGLLVTLVAVLAIAAVYASTGEAPKSFIPFLGGMFLAHALVVAAQRFYLERGFARLLSEL